MNTSRSARLAGLSVLLAAIGATAYLALSPRTASAAPTVRPTPTTPVSPTPPAELTRNEFAALVDSRNWPLIYRLARCQAALHPTQPEWKQLAELAATALADGPGPRIPQSPAHLSATDQDRLRALSHRVGQFTALPPPERAAQTPSLLPDVKRFASEFPDLPAAWLLQAQLALLTDRPLEGRIAAETLMVLHAWQSTRHETSRLLAALLARDWLPLTGLPADQATSLHTLVADLTPAADTPPTPEATAAVFKRLKAFNREHPLQPYGWLLQYDLAARLDRPADQAVAWSRLHPTREKELGFKR